MKKISILISAVAFLSNTIMAQSNWCATDEHFAQMAIENPSLIQEKENFNLKTRQWIDAHPRSTRNSNKGNSTPLYVIPVVYHIMNDDGATTDLVTEAQIKNSVAILNRDFRRNNSDTTDTRAIFKPYAADLEVEFKLATIDPNGNCTNGITRHNSSLTNDATDAVKGVTDAYWDANMYFNVWVVKSIDAGGSGLGAVLGYAQFPFGSNSGPLQTYGVVVLADEVKKTNNRTLTHEIGHCLNLYHTHQDGCANDCKTSGDECCDTPQQSAPVYNCNNGNTCSDATAGSDFVFTGNPPDPEENYMSYSDGCQNMFTLDQKDRVHAAFATASFLTSLTSTANRTATGTEPGHVAAICADFSITKNMQIACKDAVVSFKDESHGGTPISWNWDFGDGGTSILQNPSYVYATPGKYNVTLKVKSLTDSSTTTKNNIIDVKSITGGLLSPFYENFEDSNFPTLTDENKEWTLVNGSTVKWLHTQIASFSGFGSLALPLKSVASEKSYQLISPTIDFSNAICNNLTFKYAYAKRYSSSKDQLNIYVSKDCGEIWSTLYQKTATNLATTDSLHTNTFIPIIDEWVTEEISLANYAGRDHILIKFEIITGNGNYFYIDDIDVGCNASTSIDEENKFNISIFPNPFESDATLILNFLEDKNVFIELYDVLGKSFYSSNMSFVKGNHQIKLNDLTSLEKGIYFIKIGAEKNSITKKIIKY